MRRLTVSSQAYRHHDFTVWTVGEGKANTVSKEQPQQRNACILSPKYAFAAVVMTSLFLWFSFIATAPVRRYSVMAAFVSMCMSVLGVTCNTFTLQQRGPVTSMVHSQQTCILVPLELVFGGPATHVPSGRVRQKLIFHAVMDVGLAPETGQTSAVSAEDSYGLQQEDIQDSARSGERLRRDDGSKTRKHCTRAPRERERPVHLLLRRGASSPFLPRNQKT